MNRFEQSQQDLRVQPKAWLVTDAASFIGANLLQALLKLDETVVGFDDFSTWQQRNCDKIKGLVGAERWARFTLIDCGLCDLSACQRAAKNQ